ncbi:major facilitator superfamily protein [Hirsutella rhossiliensis]|uniref:Major facilitator superfamily domain-containing protein n=1 Tax=Hirsutella rhossiliensis TaxID=111463 RepID=A0A9P8MS90_9HYPO|nr:major facilitator superfamily domain-containing protein [Hirsutella rhossiliensis]KAH0958272.1 major facilitator superfamily domain-containing protein [Hirsutella rhossiliensis]
MQAVKTLLPRWPGASSSPSPATYQPLHQTEDDDDDDHPHGTASTMASPEDGPDMPARHRDAAALLLIRLGRSPDERIHVSADDDARILRQIDLALLPLMLAVYFLQALDKATLSYASIFGLIEDTHLVGNQFSWLGSIVFLAQLAMQLPISFALVKLPIGKFTSAMVLAWGVSLTFMTWAHNFTGLMVARFFLGAFEASVGPSFIAVTQMWWRRREQTMRVGSWYCMNGLTWVFGSLITYGLAKIDSDMKPYQIIFLFFGVITVGVGFLMLYWMPDSPIEAKFLSDNDKVLAIWRLRHNQMGVMSREWRSDHFYDALRDVKTWLWFAMMFCISVPSNGLSTFGPLIIKSFVSDPFHTMLFNVPVGILHVISVSSSAYLSMRWKFKGPVIIALCAPPLIGLAILFHFPHDEAHRAVLLTGYFFLSTFTGITPLIYAWSSQNTAGDTKRKTTSAIVFIGASAGNVVGPLLFRPDDAPEFTLGIRLNIRFFAAISLLAIVTMCYITTLNRRQSARRLSVGKPTQTVDLSLETAANAERIERHHTDGRGDKTFLDRTDRENEDFVYVS